MRFNLNRLLSLQVNDGAFLAAVNDGDYAAARVELDPSTGMVFPVTPRCITPLKIAILFEARMLD